MNKLKSFAKKRNLAILLIHHTSKMDNPNDPFFSISGTRGLTGALDLMMVIKKENVADKQAKLYMRGRDVDNVSSSELFGAAFVSLFGCGFRAR